VLPFANHSPDPDQDFFTDGMVEEIVTALSRFRSLFVIASGSSLSLKGKGLSPREAAARLAVRYVLDGSVRRAGNRVRVAVALIDTREGRQLWAERFDDSLDDIFALQDRVALSVAGRLEPAILKDTSRKLSVRPTTSLSSYELLLRATALRAAEGPEDIAAAVPLLERALELDPNHARAIAMLASCQSIQIIFTSGIERERLRKRIHELVRSAVRLAPDDGDVLATAAMGFFHTRQSAEDLGAAVSLIDRALELNPGSARIWGCSGWIRNVTDHPEVAVEHFQRALKLDPLSPRHQIVEGLGIANMRLTKFPEAISQLREAAELSQMPELHLFLAICYSNLQQMPEACSALAKFEALIGAPADTLEWVKSNPFFTKALKTIREDQTRGSTSPSLE
jgi:adenylate cyclase